MIYFSSQIDTSIRSKRVYEHSNLNYFDPIYIINLSSKIELEGDWLKLLAPVQKSVQAFELAFRTKRLLHFLSIINH